MRPFSKHSPQWVERQLTHFEATVPYEHIFIPDPVFGLGRKRTLEMCKVLGNRRYRYGIETRVDVLAPDLVSDVRAAGVEAVYLGLESASVHTLMRMNKVASQSKAEAYPKQALKFLEACFESDLTPAMGIMLGFPGDSEADYQASLDFIKEVGNIHDRVAARTGVETGFVPFAFFTKTYEGSPLAENVERDFPGVVLRDEPFVGERTILSPSPGLELGLAKEYQKAIVSQGRFTPLARERVGCYFVISLEEFLADRPELVDDQGVIAFGDSLSQYFKAYDPFETMPRYEKAKV
jgi:radical SAM superfamily enzyme YgiQ (UPF0313 family)